MSKKCPNCGLVNFDGALKCDRCVVDLTLAGEPATEHRSLVGQIAKRAAVCFLVSVTVVLGFYVSLVVSAQALGIHQKATIRRATAILEDRGFRDAVFLLQYVAVYRADDNWLNASVSKESAYAATNFPFEVMTVYPDFFTYPTDDVERAAILLHESKHLEGKDEHDAYEFVWRHRRELGWTKDRYGDSAVWRNVRTQTRDNVPELFNCADAEYGDCTDR